MLEAAGAIILEIADIATEEVELCTQGVLNRSVTKRTFDGIDDGWNRRNGKMVIEQPDTRHQKRGVLPNGVVLKHG